MPKFFVNNINVKNNNIIIEKDYNHIKNVLRKNVGDELEICNIDNSKNYLCTIQNITDKEVECKIKNEITDNTESNIKISVIQGLPKAEKMELIIQKSVELGAYDIIPLEMKRCVVKLKEKDAFKKIQRWQKISEVASKQCGRNIIPKVKDIYNIKKVCNEISNYDAVIVAYENEEENNLKDEIENLKKVENISNIAIIIGPEGGFEYSEIETLKKAGAKIVTLGKRILRTETVAISLISILMYELENS